MRCRQLCVPSRWRAAPRLAGGLHRMPWRQQVAAGQPLSDEQVMRCRGWLALVNAPCSYWQKKQASNCKDRVPSAHEVATRCAGSWRGRGQG